MGRAEDGATTVDAEGNGKARVGARSSSEDDGGECGRHKTR